MMHMHCTAALIAISSLKARSALASTGAHMYVHVYMHVDVYEWDESCNMTLIKMQLLVVCKNALYHHN